MQAARLRSLLTEILPGNRFWQKKFDDAGLDSSTVETIEDLSRLPLTTKQELVEDQQSHPPYGSNLTYEMVAYSRIHATSGTTGAPLRWLDTPDSWNWLMRCWAQIYSLIGITPTDRFCFPFSFGPFLGFWAAFEGATRLGNLCLPGGGMSSLARLELMLQNAATVICCTPTYALRLAEVAQSQGIDLPNSSVRAILVAGEPGGNIPATRKQIEQGWGARIFDHWGMTEIGALAIECVEKPGSLYLLETECIAEILDPTTEQPVSEGQEGELVITNLGRTGSPLIRYRTGDRVRAAKREPDGLQLLCLEGGILGRTDEMMTIRGNNVYPSKLEDVIRSCEDVAEFRIEVSTRGALQHVKIEVEPIPDARDFDGTLKRLANTVKDRLNFTAEIVAVPHDTLPRFELKGRRFFRVD